MRCFVCRGNLLPVRMMLVGEKCRGGDASLLRFGLVPLAGPSVCVREGGGSARMPLLPPVDFFGSGIDGEGAR